MIRRYRERFNREFSPERYETFVTSLEKRVGAHIGFPLSETPCFLPRELFAKLVDVSQTLVGQLLGNAEYQEAAAAVVPAPFREAHSPRPAFLAVDFGLVQGPSGFEARLVELQAFPSLYGFQLLLAETSRELYGLEELSPYAPDLTHDTYVRSVGNAILGEQDPAETVLLEIDPQHQKTWPDFAMTEQIWGVKAVDFREIERQGTRLFMRRNGTLTRVKRIYNRVIPDELERRGLTWPFAGQDDLEVEWAGSPDWFFRISKFSIPWLRHPWVPRTSYLNDLTTLPEPRDQWLLKPLFSFAGGGIIFAPTDEQIAAIPSDQRSNYILQERVSFTPAIDTPHGMTQVELRIMLVQDGDGYRAVIPLGRMGRGKMMGVDHNKGLKWVGASAVLID
jgi:hypothetical protein